MNNTDNEVTNNDRAINRLSMLDHFAGLAMQGYLANPFVAARIDALDISNEDEYSVITRTSYAIAAAMLEARKAYIP